MSWIAVGIGVGTWAVDKFAKGMQARGNKEDVQAGKDATWDIYKEQSGMLGERLSTSKSASLLDLNYGVGSAQSAATGQLKNVFTDVSTAVSRSGMANVGQINTGLADAQQSITNKFKTDIQKMFDTKSQADIDADFAYRSGIMSAEEAREQSLTQLESAPTTFMEGAFG